MAKQVKLTAQMRPTVGRSAVKQIRRQGFVPAVIYGGKTQPQALQVPTIEISNALAHAVGEHLLVDLEIEENGLKTNRMALIQEVQHHPLGGDILHVDFQAVSADETLEASIPVEAIGEAAGVKNSGGVLEQPIRELEVECLPKDLPEVVRVDVSNLEIGDVIHVKDLPLPDGVKPLAGPELPVFLVTMPRVEVEPAPEEVITAPEVIKEKKEEAAPAAEEKEKK